MRVARKIDLNGTIDQALFSWVCKSVPATMNAIVGAITQARPGTAFIKALDPIFMS